MKKVALITGGAGGIGFAIARAFLREGFAVAIVDRDASREATVLEELSSLGQAIYKIFDLSQIGDYPALIREITSELGRIDILVNNAAYSTWGKIADITLPEWDQYLRVNLSSAFFMAQVVAPEIEKAGGGAIINISSVRSMLADGRHMLYSVAKGGLVAMTHELAVSLWKQNIRVNAVSPGYVITPMTRHNLETPGWLDQNLKELLIPRMIEAEDIAEIVLFLASDAAIAINGQDIFADGGLSIHKGKPDS